MITKKTTPIIETVNGIETVTGSKVEYRIFGLLFYRKTLITPEKYGIRNYDYRIY